MFYAEPIVKELRYKHTGLRAWSKVNYRNYQDRIYLDPCGYIDLIPKNPEYKSLYYKPEKLAALGYPELLEEVTKLKHKLSQKYKNSQPTEVDVLPF